MEKKKNIFVVGCGRNGTSMTAGLFRNSGLFMGERLHRPAVENPTGFFEDALINKINNDIITRCLPSRAQINGIEYSCDSPLSKGWLARLPLDQKFTLLPDEENKIRALTSKHPFCFKDTRFCYILDLWRSFVPDAKTICVFRPPNVAASSILKCCRIKPDLSHIAISVDQAFEIWTLAYTHVLERHAASGEWLFLRYEDILYGRAFDVIEEFTSIGVDRSFPQHALNHLDDSLPIPDQTAKVYDQLNDVAQSFP